METYHPCPQCGCPLVHVDMDDTVTPCLGALACGWCAWHGPWKPTYAQAVAAWNAAPEREE